MEDLTILFFLLMIGTYLLQMFLKKTDRNMEIRMCTIILSICAICSIITDDSLMAEELGYLPIFPSVFILLHSIVGLLKE